MGGGGRPEGEQRKGGGGYPGGGRRAPKRKGDRNPGEKGEGTQEKGRETDFGRQELPAFFVFPARNPNNHAQTTILTVAMLV